MSYDFTLKSRETGKPLRLSSKHHIEGGNRVVGGTDECWLNVTYNYSSYYDEACASDDRFLETDRDNHSLDALNGKTGLESIPLLADLIDRIMAKYIRDGKWIRHEVMEKVPFDKRTGEEIIDFDKDPDFLTRKVNWAEIPKMLDEGDTSNYWRPTAKNAIIALEGLLTFAKAHPEGVWEVC